MTIFDIRNRWLRLCAIFVVLAVWGLLVLGFLLVAVFWGAVWGAVTGIRDEARGCLRVADLSLGRGYFREVWNGKMAERLP